MNRTHRILAVLVAAAGVACTSFDNPVDDTVEGLDTTRFSGLGVGVTCSGTDQCRDGLACTSGTCQPTGTATVDEKCLLSAECGAGLNCGWSGFCTDAVPSPGECSSSSDCAKGKFCRLIGFSGVCDTPSADAGDLGAACESTADCLAGLSCSTASRTCVAGALLLNPDLFMGTACPDESTRPFGVRTVLPGLDPDADFYSLPFPNDARLVDGHVDLSGHPVPGPGIMGYDLVAAVIQALQDELDGFSVYPLVFFRFTRAVDPSTLSGEGAGATVRFVELPSGTAIPFTHTFVDEPGKYICGHRLAVRPVWSHPLKARTTYAVVVTRGVRSLAAEGQTPEAPKRLDDLALLLDAEAPSTAAQQAAWEAYAPLRAWLATGALAVDDVVGATVFTTDDPTAVVSSLRAASLAAAAPTVVPGSVTVCKAGVHSPCATPGFASTPEGLAGDADPRDCPAGGPSGYTEVHFKLTLPVFQDGERPYLGEGGAVHLVDGLPQAVGTEPVCVALALPSEATPAAGWPLILYAHGTGGSFRTGASTYGSAAAQGGVAVLGIDQPMHGSRRGDSQADPGPLFYNYGNPKAAKGNLVQGAADNFALVRFAKAFDDTLGSAGQVSFDASRIVFMGHSQGATTGPLFLPYEDDLIGAVLTGAGGSLVEGLLGKKKPYDASVGVRLGLQEVEIDAWHPVLALIEHYFDATEPALYAPLAFATPEGKALSVLNVMGWDDSYAPWQGGVIFAASLGGAWVTPDSQPVTLDVTGYDPVADLGLSEASTPVQGNVTGPGGKKVTGATSAAVSDGTYDGHFVGVRNPTEQKRIATFLADLFANKIPRVVP
jgi:enamine deaminase RidA (YjgF/YER057c/UK114 family)